MILRTPALLLALLLPLAARADKKPSFTEVDPRDSSPQFRAYVQKGLDKLTALGTPIGKATRKFIEAGHEKLDLLNDLTRKDYLRVRKELLSTGPDLDVNAFATLHDQKSHAARALKKALDGYQWDDRIYISEGMAPELLAETLVHETNHVLNHSEEHYRTAKDILREEYRAFYTERMLRGEKMTAVKCKNLKESVIRDYALKKVTAADVPDVPPGKLIP
ncbi:MAG: hypothetical protein JST92_14160 [Deltaproteobacteria bacterium]|nr:hypothetical protein [Deltaproteobacteria bacterium]